MGRWCARSPSSRPAHAGSGCRSTVSPAPRTYGTGRAAYRYLAASEAPITAAIVFNDQATVGFINAAQLAGNSVPGDLSVLSIGMGEEAAEVDPPVTTITPPVAALRAITDRRPHAHRRGGGPPPVTQSEVLMDAPLVERGSVRDLA